MLNIFIEFHGCLSEEKSPLKKGLGLNIFIGLAQHCDPAVSHTDTGTQAYRTIFASACLFPNAGDEAAVVVTWAPAQKIHEDHQHEEHVDFHQQIFKIDVSTFKVSVRQA